MSKVEKFSRIIIKRTIIPSLSATTAPTDDHTILPAWSISDVYVGEFFLNEVDQKLWLRTNNTNIKEITLSTPSTAVTANVYIAGLSGGTYLSFVDGLFTGLH
jgi:hypothetical protein